MKKKLSDIWTDLVGSDFDFFDSSLFYYLLLFLALTLFTIWLTFSENKTASTYNDYPEEYWEYREEEPRRWGPLVYD